MITLLAGADPHVLSSFAGSHAFDTARPSILTWAVVTKVHLLFAQMSRIAGFAVAAVVIHQLDTGQRSSVITRIAQTLVYIPLAFGSHVAWHAVALVATHLVNTPASVKARPIKAIVYINFAQFSQRAMRTATSVRINPVMANSPVNTRIGTAVIHIVFAIRPLESHRTFAHKTARKIVTTSAIQTWLAITLVYFRLAVASGIAWLTQAPVLLPVVLTRAIIFAQQLQRHPFSYAGIQTTHHFHITNHSIPPRVAATLEPILFLKALPVFTRTGFAPVHNALAASSCIPIRTMAAVSLALAQHLACCPIQTGTRVTSVNLKLTITSGKALLAITAIAVHPVNTLSPV